MYKRPLFGRLTDRIQEPSSFIQVLAGPRQTGKTTLARQIMELMDIETHYASADEPALKDSVWIDQQWEAGRRMARLSNGGRGPLLILDEIQKIPGWSEAVKRLWDEDAADGLQLQVMVLGSSTLLIQEGLTESLAGRFEVIPVTHWSFEEMRDAFGWDVNQYVFYGGYPGAAELIHDEDRWARYVNDSLIETTISRDILQMRRVHKPALLRRLFELGCAYSGQVLSYQKMLGQLQDAGNTTTLAHYLNLLESAGLITGLPKYSGQRTRQRGSSPKLLIMNTALMSVSSGLRFDEARNDPQYWGRLTESAVGATLANGLTGSQVELFYWAARNKEVDFVGARGKKLVAFEVKTGVRKQDLSGVSAFAAKYPVTKKILVGTGGIPIEEFLLTNPVTWFE
jgi:predicted AAA+ superfamily ATPase